MFPLEFPPNHFINDTGIALYNLDDFGGDIFVYVVGNRDAVVAGGVHRDGCVDRLKQRVLIDTGDEEAGFVKCFRTLGGCADADSGERMADGGEERTLFRERAAIGHHRKCIHLQAVVVVEAERFVLDDARIQLKSGGLETLARARMATVQNRHIVLNSHGVDGVEQRQEVLLCVNVLFAVSAQQDVPALLQAQPLMNIRSLYLSQVLVQHLGHRRTGHVGTLLGQATICQIPPSML